jgi:hypothetical protein
MSLYTVSITLLNSWYAPDSQISRDCQRFHPSSSKKDKKARPISEVTRLPYWYPEITERPEMVMQCSSTELRSRVVPTHNSLLSFIVFRRRPPPYYPFLNPKTTFRVILLARNVWPHGWPYCPAQLFEEGGK